jgi:EmrB/QacA subfamily drug resistance transporter
VEQSPTVDADLAVPRREFRLVLVGLLLALALASLDQNIVAPALPRIVGDLGGGSHLDWVVIAFMLASTATTPLYGKLSDMYGRKPLFFVAILLFLVGSVLCGQSRDMAELIAYRGLQGLGAGGLMALAQTTIGDLISPRQRGRYQGLFTAVFAAGSVAGPLLGGVLTDALSWRWIFYVNVPVGGAALFFLAVGLRRAANVSRHRIDYLGATLVTVATAAVVLMLSLGGRHYPWTSPEVLSLGAGAAVLTALLVPWERRAAEPVLPPHLFRVASFVVSVAGIGLTAMALFAPLVYLPLYFQLVEGSSPTVAGLLMSPLMGGVIIASVGGGWLVTVLGRYKVFAVVGLAAAVVAFLGMAWETAEAAGVFWLAAMLVVLGLGLGLIMPTLTVAIQNAVDRGDMGAATSASAFFRSLGGAVGVAVAGAIMAAVLGRASADRSLADLGVQQVEALTPAVRQAALAAYRQAIAVTFLAGAAIAAVAFVVVLFLPELPLRSFRPEERRTPADDGAAVAHHVSSASLREQAPRL